MANEPDNLILLHLRELRATLADHTARFDRIDERFAQMDARINERFIQMDLRLAHIDKRFDRLEQRFDSLRDLVSHTFVLSSANSLKIPELEQRYEFSEGEQRRIDGRVDDIEHRLSDVEKKVDE
jgi:chromosome segregation ATPase